MALTPLDIQNKKFGRALRGYSERQVDDFLDQIVRELEGLIKDNAALREQLETLSAKVEQYDRLEDTLHNTLVVAQQTADEVKASARKQAEVLIREAEQRAAAAVREGQERAAEASRTLAGLAQRARVFRAQIRGMLSSQLELLDSEARRLEAGERELEAAAAVDPEDPSDGKGAPGDGDTDPER